ncbi:MAG: hypothetical protein AMXMBFR48_07710 [Ignavibacteriales bacterium]
MESLQLAGVLVVFLIMSGLMFFRKIPALLALPIMAFFIPLISGVSPEHVLTFVLGQGSTRLSEAYTIAIFGSMLSILLQKTGVAENFIKLGAELAGDKPWTIAMVMMLFIILLFTTLGGLGAIIMVSTVVLPILISVGLSPITTVGVFLLGLSIGGILNVGNWAVYIEVLKLTPDEVRFFALIMFAISFLVAAVYLTIQLYRDGHDINFKKILLYLALLILLSFLYLPLRSMVDEKSADKLAFLTASAFEALKYLILAGLFLVTLFSLKRIFSAKTKPGIFWGAYLIPVVPLLLILVFEMNFIAAFITGLIYGFLTTYQKNSINILVRSILEGGSVVMPAVALMLGIGMLLNAVMGPSGNAASLHYPTGWPVLSLLKPVISSIIPTGKLSYIITFGLAAPLALYRGPLNVWGMGYGIAAILLASGMVPGAIMGMLLSVGQIQGISDPTNTQNVWLANEMRVEVQKILWNTIAYTWCIAVLGLAVSAFIYYP